MSHDQEALLVWFHYCEGIGNRQRLRLLTQFESIAEIVKKIQRRQLTLNWNKFRETISFSDAQIKVQQARNLGCSVVTWADEEYPESLRQLYDPPAILYMRGNASLVSQHGVGIVGTRRYTPYGRDVATQFATQCVHANLVIVSGLALGIDTFAHVACLKNNGSTIAVLGSGVDVPSPVQNATLAESILSAGGLLISEVPFTMPATKFSFPQRNRIIAGLSRSIVVIEAGESSGALITARQALDQGKDVYAVPGNIFSHASVGANRLIQAGAKPIIDIAEYLHDLNPQFSNEQDGGRLILNDPIQQTICQALDHGAQSIDDLIGILSLPIEQISTAITQLELDGVVMRQGEYVMRLRGS